MKKTSLRKNLTPVMLAVPASALMLGAAEAGSTVGLNFQSWYYDSGASPQTIGFGFGYQTTGVPVTAKAFGVEVADWTNSDPLPSQSAIAATIPFGGTLVADLTATNMWQSGRIQQGVWGPAVGVSWVDDWPNNWLAGSEVLGLITPGDYQATWSYIDNTGWSMELDGLAAKFPNGYVVDLVGGGKVTSASRVTITENSGSTVVANVGFTLLPDGMGVGASPVLTQDSITLSNPSRNVSSENCALSAIIVTDKPVVHLPPADALLSPGETLTLTAEAVGIAPITYQWRKNGTPIPGATSATYTKAGTDPVQDSGTYDVVATNAYGNGTSTPAAITILTPASLTWDSDTGSAGPQDGSGTWNATGTNWWDGSADVAWSGVDFATFGSGGTGPYTVTLGSSVQAGGITFSSGGYTITSSGNETLAIGSAGVTTTAGTTAKITAPLVGPGGLVKSGPGTLTLTGKSTFTGPVDVTEGTLSLPEAPPGYWYQALLNSSVYNLSPGTTLEMSNGAFGWYGNNNATGITVNIDGATCYPSGAFGIGYVMTGGLISGGTSRLDLGSSGGFDGYITSKSSPVTSVVSPDGGILLRNDSGQSEYVFTTEAGTTPGGVDLDLQASISQWTGDPVTLVKEGPGTLKLSANNSYAGSVVVNAGTMILAGTNTAPAEINGGSLVVSGQLNGTTTVNAGSLAVSGKLNGVVWLKDDTTLQVTASVTGSAITTTGPFNVGTDYTAPSGMNVLNFGGVNSTTVAPISVGDLYLDSPVTVNVTSIARAVGQYPLISASGFVAVYDMTLGTLPAGITATLVDDTEASGTIYLDVTEATVNYPLWTGADGGTWDINVTNNWSVGGSPGKYQEGDIVTFDDSAATRNVVLDTTVSPTSTTIITDEGYTFSGSGGIAGLSDLVKLGTGDLTILTSNSFSGAVSISGGGSVTVGGGGTTGQLGGAGPITLDASTLVFNRSDNQTLNRAIVGSGGTFIKEGTGTLTMNAPGNTADIIVNGGTLSVNGGGFSSGFAPGKTITVNNASLYNPGFHSMGSAVGGGGDVPAVILNQSSWLLNHEQYIRFLTLNESSTSNTPGNEGLRTLNDSVYTVVAAATSSTIGSTLNLVSPVTLDVADGAAVDDLVISGPIMNSGTMTKIGAGTLALTGTNTYTGDTVVNDGTLAVNGSSIPDENKLVIDGGMVQVTGTETVGTLFFGTVEQAAGTWGASGSGATHIDNTRFSGTGMVLVTGGPGYSAWASANAPGQTIDEDHDFDGVPNGIEYFMGLSGSSFTANPGIVNGAVAWTKGGNYTGTYGVDYVVQTSDDLDIWTDVPAGDPNLTDGATLGYLVPTGEDLIFVRLKVTGP